MTPAQLIHHRLNNQKLITTDFKTPQQVVQYMGAVQAQEYAMSKWAIGLRAKGLKDEDVEKAFNNGEILRTHVMRPTWHYVAPQDIRWLLELTAPRVNATVASYYKKQELDNKVFKRSNTAIEKALQGGKFLTRAELKTALEKAKIKTDALRLSFIVSRAELDAVVCSGPRQGKQFTYALLEERVPPARKLTRDEAVRELCQRYFSTRWPASLQDFAWWSGLTVKDAKDGLNMLGDDFMIEKMDGQEYVVAGEIPALKGKQKVTYLMPDYDEYGISYKDRSAIFPKAEMTKGRDNLIFSHMVVLEGKIGGTWSHEIKKDTVKVDVKPFSPLNKTQQQAVQKAVGRFAGFIGKKSVE